MNPIFNIHTQKKAEQGQACPTHLCIFGTRIEPISGTLNVSNHHMLHVPFLDFLANTLQIIVLHFPQINVTTINELKNYIMRLVNVKGTLCAAPSFVFLSSVWTATSAHVWVSWHAFTWLSGVP